MGFWQDRQTCVLGGSGFLGSHLVEHLLQAGARVVVIDDMGRGRNRVDGATYYKADISQANYLPHLLERCSVVFNLAARVAGVIYNQRNHLEMFDTNASLQVAPLWAAQVAGVKHFLQVSSVCVYAPEYLSPCQEDSGLKGEPTKANEGYSWAKRLGERAASWSTIPHVVVARPSNLFGPRDYFDERAHVIPALINKCIHDDEVVVNGTGNEAREFLYVEDAARGMMHLVEHGVHQESYNLGTHGATCVPIRVLTKMIQQATGTEHKQVSFSTEHDAGDERRYSDCSKIHALGWRHEIGLEEGLEKTVKWFAGERVTA